MSYHVDNGVCIDMVSEESSRQATTTGNSMNVVHVKRKQQYTTLTRYGHATTTAGVTKKTWTMDCGGLTIILTRSCHCDILLVNIAFGLTNNWVWTSSPSSFDDCTGSYRLAPSDKFTDILEKKHKFKLNGILVWPSLEMMTTPYGFSNKIHRETHQEL
jgi:hypothetical protein